MALRAVPRLEPVEMKVDKPFLFALVCEALGHREFVLQHPQIVVRLLDRAAEAKSTGLEPAMRALAPLRFRFWNPAIARVGAKARTLLRP